MRLSAGKFVSILLAIYWSIAITGNASPVKKKNGLTLRIIHTNDMHSRFEETSATSETCLPSDKAMKKCYGGFARIATLVRQARKSAIPTLFLDAGDTYQDGVWFQVHRWKIVSKFLNLLSPNATSLGNHEFDDGPNGLIPFLNEAKFPIVTSNLDLTKEPELAASKLKNSTVLMVNGVKIAIIGYLTPETSTSASTGKIKFLDEVKSIKWEIDRLRANGVKIFIALGHSGYPMDKKIAAEVEGLDVVIGGHTHSFLYTGNAPDREKPQDTYEYPTTVIQKPSGRKVYVAQAYAYTKYLGSLTIDFDNNGDVTKIIGNPILLDSQVEQAKDILDELEKWRKEVNKVIFTTVGYTKILLDGYYKNCRRYECNLGNLITDAMVDYNAKRYTRSDGWTDAAIAIYDSGSIRASIPKRSNETITMGDVLSVLPFKDSMLKITLNGGVFREILEWSVYSVPINDSPNLNGTFLQFSGAQVVYDLSQPAGSRVVSANVRCANCKQPRYVKLADKDTYAILSTEFLRKGGNNYTMLTNLNYVTSGITMDEVFVDYLKVNSPVNPKIDGRIIYRTKSKNTVIT